MVAARSCGLVAELDRLTCGLTSTAHDNGHVGKSGIVESAARGLGHDLAFGVGQVDRFPIGPLCCNTRDTGLSETDCMRSNDGKVEVLAAWLEECDGWNIDTRDQRLALVVHRGVVDGGKGGDFGRLAVC